MSKAETILELLENGKWHHLKDIAEKTQISGHKIKNITNFLAKYNFAKLDDLKQRVKLDPPTSKFLKKVRQIEKEEIFEDFLQFG